MTMIMMMTQTDPAGEQSKIIRWSKSPWNQSGRKGKDLRRKGFAKEPSLEFRMKH